MPPASPVPGSAAAPAGARDTGGPAPAGTGRHRQHRGHRARRPAARAGLHREGPLSVPVRARRLLRAAAGLAAAVVLLAGVPWALEGLTGPPPAGQLSDGTGLRALAAAAWLAWALFTVALAAEVTARACGRAVPRLPAAAPLQALAAALAGAAVITALHAGRGAARDSRRGHPGPAVAVTAAAWPGRAAGTGGQLRSYRVRDGDDLWAIAARYLGSAGDWQQIFRLNQGRTQPGGGTLTDPALIQPGWVLLIPRPASGPGAPQPAPPGRPGTTAPGGGRPAGPPRGPAPAGSTWSRGAHPGQVAVRLPSGALAGIAIAVMVATALALAAVQRRRRYRPRLGPPGSPPPGPPPLPGVIGALRRAARTGPPAGGLGTGDPSTAEPGRLPSLDPADPDRPGRRPGTIPLGIRGDGSEAVADIAALGGLGLAGPGARPAARAILVSLLAQGPPGAGGLPAVIIPAADAAALLPGTGLAAIGGLAVPATFDAALGDLESLTLTLARTRGTGDLAGPGPASDAGGPGITLIAASEPGPGRRLAGILQAGRRTGITAVLLGAWPAGTTCQVAADGTVTAVTPPHPDLDGIRLFTLGPADAAAITSVLREASGSPPPAGPAPPARDGGGQQPRGPAVPAPAAPSGPAAATEPDADDPPGPGDRPVQVSVLGPLRITAAGLEISGGLRKARELLAFLAVHPGGVSGDAISEALWPGSGAAHAAAQRNLALRRARDMLRTAAGRESSMWILHAAGRYRLDPALISTDLQQFTHALDQARQAAGPDRLAACRRAVALYRGELADGAGYEWAEPHAETARRRALDAWTAIAEILQPSDPGQALCALEAALAHDPYNEYLYEKIMRLQAAAGRPEAVRRTLQLLETRLAGLDLTPAARTRHVAASLLSATGPPPAPNRLP